MDLRRRGTEIVIDLDRPEDVPSLYAVMTNNPAAVTPDQFQKGQMIYGWLFAQVTELMSQVQTGAIHEEVVKNEVRKRRGTRAKDR